MSLGASAATEWQGLVATAVVGTDRRLPPAASPGWDTWACTDDPAVEVLDRAAAVVVARRAGALPLPAPDVAVPVAPPDDRRPCPADCAARLARLLSGEHEMLLPEWFELLERSGWAPPWQWLPTLLLRGRRDASLDLTVRHLARGRAAWLAELVPELGVATRVPARAGTGPLVAPAAPADSAAVASSIVSAVASGQVPWAAVPQLERAVASLEPSTLPAFIASLSSLPFDVHVERTRAAVLSLAEFRHEMLGEFTRCLAAAADHPSPPATRPDRPT